MDDLIKLVKTYRLTAGLAERIRLAEEIFRLIEPDLRVFVFSSVSHEAAKDALQEILKAVATSLKQFKGDTVKEFWAWCYRIARNKLKHIPKSSKHFIMRLPAIPNGRTPTSRAKTFPRKRERNSRTIFAMRIERLKKRPGSEHLLYRMMPPKFWRNLLLDHRILTIRKTLGLKCMMPNLKRIKTLLEK
jgi:DNA-directed RNA polymerase specialized sigma24 family protein